MQKLNALIGLVILGCYLMVPCHASIKSEEQYFPESYRQSRALFLKAIEELRSELSHVIHYDSFRVDSEAEQNLFTDFLYLDCRDFKKSSASPLLLLTSGVHGTEAKVGAAAQIWFLKNEAFARCREGLSQVYFHALNPFGFHEGRRFTQNNVDLNRNFPTSSEIYDQDNSSYKALENLLNPKKAVGNLILRSYTLFKKLLSKLVGGFDVSAIRQASVGGQYEFPQGIYYGGKAPEPVVHFFKDKLKQTLNDHEDVLHYDFHTGLGKKGVLHMIVGPKLSDYGSKKIAEVFRPLAPENFELTTSQDPGFYEVEGDIIDFVTQLKDDGRIVSFTVEYGTVGLGLFAQLKTLTRLVNENQGHHFGYKNARVKEKVKKRLKDIFHPQQETWLEKVKRTNSYLLTEVLERFIASLK